MRKIFSIILAVVLTISISSTAWCNAVNEQNAIETTVNTFYSSVEQYNMESFLGVLTPEIASNIKNGNRSEDEIYDVGNLLVMGNEDPEGMPRFNFTNRRITIQEKTANTATVKFEATVKVDEHDPENSDTNETSDTLKLNLIDGRWLISSLNTGRPSN
jgi:hypothetical protein